MKSLSYFLNPDKPRNLDDLIDYTTRMEYKEASITLELFTEERVSPDFILTLYCGRFIWHMPHGESGEIIKIYGGADAFSSEQKKEAIRSSAQQAAREDLLKLQTVVNSVQSLNILSSF